MTLFSCIKVPGCMVVKNNQSLLRKSSVLECFAKPVDLLQVNLTSFSERSELFRPVKLLRETTKRTKDFFESLHNQLKTLLRPQNTHLHFSSFLDRLILICRLGMTGLVPSTIVSLTVTYVLEVTKVWRTWAKFIIWGSTLCSHPKYPTILQFSLFFSSPICSKDQC